MSIAVCSDVICKKSRIELCDRMEQCGGAAVFHVCFIIIYSNFAHQKKRRGVVLRLRFSYIFSPDTGATLSALLKSYYKTLPHIKCSHPCVQSFIICKAGHKLRMLYNPDPLYPYQMHSMQLVGKYLPPAHCAYIPEYEEWKPM